MTERQGDSAPEIGDELIAGRRGDVGRMPADMPGWMARTIVAIDRTSYRIGWLVAFLVVPIFVVMVWEIVARYAFRAPTMWAYDVSRMLYGALFMLGAGYALSRGLHIRADFIYRTLSVRTQGRIDFALYVLCYFPGLLVLLWASTDFAWAAIERGERGMDTAWMPMLGPIKSALPIGVALLLFQGVSEVLKSWYAATRGQWPR
jgi:TRAP-type mannitol/chloroaromatic compound transport system permease small subunit